MKVSTEKIEPNQVVLEVEVDAETVEKSLDQAHRRLASRLNIPGFRRGKAPRAMVERFVGRPALLEEALDKLVPELYQQIIADEQIDAVAQPTLEITQYDPVTFKAVVPVRPEVDLGDYQAVRVDLTSAEVTDQEIDEALDSLREQQAVWEPVERVAQMGDQVTIDLVGTKDGESIIDRQNFEYPLRENLTIPVPGFAHHLIGLAEGETKEIHLEFPEDSEHTEVAGSSFDFTVTVHEVKAKRLPELTDEFARELGEEFPTIEALRTRIAENLGRRKLAEQRNQAEEQTINAVLDQAQLDLPPGLIDREVDHLVEERQRLLAAQRVSIETYLAITQQTEEQMRAELREEAVKRLRRRFVLDEIAKREGIEASPEEIEAEIRLADAAEEAQEAADPAAQHAGHRHAGHRHRPGGQRRRRSYDTPAVRAAMSEIIRRRKTVRHLVERATEGKLGSAEEATATTDERTEAEQAAEPSQAGAASQPSTERLEPGASAVAEEERSGE